MENVEIKHNSKTVQKEQFETCNFKIVKSKNFKAMLPMFIESGLELKDDEPVPEGLISCFELFDMGEKRRVGGAALVFTYEEYVLRTVAVEKPYQGRGLGRWLVEYAEEEAKRCGAKRILLNAKTPGFYEKLGYQIVPHQEAPPLSDCTNCPRFHNGCDSEIMKKEWDVV